MAKAIRWVGAAVLSVAFGTLGCLPSTGYDSPPDSPDEQASGITGSQGETDSAEADGEAVVEVVEPEPAGEGFAGGAGVGEPAPTEVNAVSPFASDGRPVDAMELLDPKRHAQGGAWIREGTGLASSGDGKTALVVPHVPPPEYRWTMTVERMSGTGSLNLVFVIGGRTAMVVVDRMPDHSSGLNLLDGQTADANASTRRGAVFREGQAHVVECLVRRSGVRVSCDGAAIVDWAGSADRLSLDLRYWDDLPSNRLAVAVWQPGTRFRITKMDISPDVGTATAAAAAAPLAGSTSSHSGTPPGQWPNAPPGGRTSGSLTSSSPASGVGASGAQSADGGDLVLRWKDSVALIDHPMGTGTGFVVAKNLVATNAHVVHGAYADELTIDFAVGGPKYKATRVLYENGTVDLCLLETVVDKEPIPIAAGGSFQPGSRVTVIGNPSVNGSMMLRNAVVHGTMTTMMHIGNADFYQIDASVNPGSSGGPVLNDSGEVVAVVAMKARDEGVKALREAVGSLDDSFAAKFATSQGSGITFGVPVGTLRMAINEAQTQTPEQAMRVHYHHSARAAVQRMRMLGGIRLLQVMINVPMSVRQQAYEIKMRGIPTRALRGGGSGLKFIELIPAEIAQALSQALAEPEARRLIRNSASGLDTRVERLCSYQHADPRISDGLEDLLSAVNQTQRLLDRPPDNYQGFSQAVFRLKDAMSEPIDTLAALLDLDAAAYGD